MSFLCLGKQYYSITVFLEISVSEKYILLDKDKVGIKISNKIEII